MDMEYQLDTFALQKLDIKRELSTSNEIVRNALLSSWDEKACEYLEDIDLRLEMLKAAPRTEEERHEIFVDNI